MVGSLVIWFCTGRCVLLLEVAVKSGMTELKPLRLCPTPIGQGGRLVRPSLFWPLLQTFVSGLVKGA